MKKLLFIFAILFAVSISTYAEIGETLTNSVGTVYNDGKAVVDSLYHDGKTVVGTVYDDLKEGAVNIYPDVKSAVVSIGKAIGVAAEHVYGVLVKKYLVLGVKQAFIFLIGLMALIIGIIGWRKYTKNNQPITYRIILPTALSIIGTIVLFNVNYDEMLMGLINPEYGAINYILEYTKDIVGVH